MKRILFLIIGLCLMSTKIHAEKQIILGYVNDDVAISGNFNGNMNDAWTSGAIYVPHGTLSTLKGSRISAVKAMLQSKLNIDKLSVWIRFDLNGENIVERTIDANSTPALKRGWNNVALDEAWIIPEDISGGVYLGYSLHQTGTSYGLGNIEEPSICGLFTNIDGEGWVDNGNNGTLSLQATAEGDNIPAVNLGIVSMNVGNLYVIEQNEIKGTAKIKNNGTETVTSFDITAIVDGKQMGKTRIDLGVASGKTEVFNFCIKPDLSETGDCRVDFIIDGIDTGEDADMSDNSYTSPFTIIETPILRTILLEEFTTERCGNCPAAATLIAEYEKKPEYEGRIAVVCHHSGFQSDWLTSDADEQYEWFYNNNGSTYAPAMMVDRFTTSTTPVSNVSDYYLEPRLNARLEKMPNLGLSATVSYDNDDVDVLNIRVEGTKYADKLCDNPVITVYLVENNIPAVYQNGAGVDTRYLHNHVKRAVSTVWGEAIEFDGNNHFVYECSFNLNSDWKQNDMELIAFVSNYDESSPQHCEVENAVVVRHEEFVNENSSVSSLFYDGDTSAEYYTIYGVKVDYNNIQPGIYIRKTGHSVDKIIIE